MRFWRVLWCTVAQFVRAVLIRIECCDLGCFQSKISRFALPFKNMTFCTQPLKSAVCPGHSSHKLPGQEEIVSRYCRDLISAA